ncbi:MAG: DUF3365 domain-containing protein [Gallionellaceae bacterium]|jgi:hypothetical protein
MNNTSTPNKASHLPSLYRAAVTAVLIWTASIGGFLFWDVHVAKEHAEELARQEVRVRFNKDMAFRSWVTSHGGVYVAVDKHTQPNPYLDVPERDIETLSGKKLTLMNPAYVMRQVMGDFSGQYGVPGHLTSLKLLNPVNAPDDWERAALLRFERGEREIAEFTEIDGQPYLRQMGAFMVEQGCMKCHAKQGYKVGDVRGGISISVPMQPFLDGMYADIRKTWWPMAVIWVLGLVLIMTLMLQVRRRIEVQQASEFALSKSSAEISRANTDLTRFADVAAHHLMEPTRRLSSYTQLLERGLAAYPEAIADQGVQESLQYLGRDAGRLRTLVRDIQLYLAASQPRGEVGQEDANLVLAKAEQRLAAQVQQAHAVISAEPLPLATIDSQRLMDLFIILLDNALKHARPLNAEVVPQIAVSGERDGTLSRYRVSDNGPGIPAEYRERVFGMFETLQGASEGSSGIGLSIARRIVESRHGRIWIEDAAQGGTMVVFELPDGE